MAGPNYKKHDWSDFNFGNSFIIEIKILEGDGRTKVDFFKCNNSEKFAQVLKIVKSKYGLG